MRIAEVVSVFLLSAQDEECVPLHNTFNRLNQRREEKPPLLSIGDMRRSPSLVCLILDLRAQSIGCLNFRRGEVRHGVGIAQFLVRSRRSCA